jgi:predicted Zn finger-like uncharacterized protein
MSMVTRCPRCETTFRVTLAHLRAREGFVRCGRCSEIFNALATLSAMTSAGERPAHSSFEPPDASEELDFLAPQDDGEERAPWPALTIFAALALVLQIAYLFRVDIAARIPRAAPFLAMMCAPLGCSIEPSHDPRELAITGSELRADPVRSDVIVLSATLKNESERTRAYPALELTLTDAQNKPLARRVFTPTEYARQKAAKISPGSEVPLELALEIGNLNAAGYRLYLFYP